MVRHMLSRGITYQRRPDPAPRASRGREATFFGRRRRIKPLHSFRRGGGEGGEGREGRGGREKGREGGRTGKQCQSLTPYPCGCVLNLRLLEVPD